jgi:hypothetical protein
MLENYLHKTLAGLWPIRVSRREITSRRHFAHTGMAVICVDFAPDYLMLFYYQVWVNLMRGSESSL